MNNVNLVGRIATDLELKEAGFGKFVNFSLAINKGKENATFIPVTAFNRVAENLVQFQKKGGLISISGYLNNNSYTDKEGNKKSSMNVVASIIEYLGGANKEESSKKDGFKQEAKFEKLDDDDIPF